MESILYNPTSPILLLSHTMSTGIVLSKSAVARGYLEKLNRAIEQNKQQLVTMYEKYLEKFAQKNVGCHCVKIMYTEFDSIYSFNICRVDLTKIHKNLILVVVSEKEESCDRAKYW